MQGLWHALTIEPQHENVVAAHLVGRRIDAWVPTRPEWRSRGVRRVKVQVNVPMIRGYVLVCLTGADQYRRSLAVPGVHNFLRVGDWPGVIDARDIDRLREIEQDLAKPRPAGATFKVGEVVRMIEGAWEGIVARIKAMDPAGRIELDGPFSGRLLVQPHQIEVA